MKLSHPENFNVELATKVHEYLTAHPGRHNQHFVMQGFGCGSVGCIAGWTNLLHDESSSHTGGMAEAQRLLGLDDEECRALFSSCTSNTRALHILADFIKQANAYAAAGTARDEEKRQRKIDRVARKQAWMTWAWKLPTIKARRARKAVLTK